MIQATPIAMSLLSLLLVLAAGLGLTLRAWGRLAQPRPVAEAIGNDHGTATVEFALVFPLLLLMILLLAQTTVLMGGQAFVHYAAFAATRTAIVQLPANYFSEPQNYYAGEGGTKHALIKRAAVAAVAPVSGRLGTGSPSGELFGEALAEHFAALGQDPPRWTRSLMPDRFRYADRYTDVQLRTAYDEPGTAPVIVGPRDPLTVRVTHRFYLSVPYVWRVFADESEPRSATVRAQYTLTNEGINPALPPAPGLPREP